MAHSTRSARSTISRFRIWIAAALGISLSKLFEKLDGQEDGGEKDIPLACYEFLSAKSKEEQEQLYKILLEMDKYKAN